MVKLIYITAVIALLTGCTADLDDLIEYTEQVKQTTPVNVRPTPTFKEPVPIKYEANDMRSPFQRTSPREVTELVTKIPNCAQPKADRRKQKLESYGLDALKMSGVFTANGKKYALIMAVDGSLHKVTIGNYIGLFNGQVTAVSNTEIKINELLPDGAGCYKSKSAKLSLSGVTGNDNNV